MATEMTRAWIPMAGVQGRKGMIYFNPKTDELAFEDAGATLVELPADEEKAIRERFNFQLNSVRKDCGLPTK